MKHRRTPDTTRRALALSPLGLLGLGLAGCGGGSDALDDPRVRFVNGLADVASADFLIDGMRVKSGVANGGNGTDYVFLDDGTRRIGVRSANASSPLAESGFGFAERLDHSVVAYGTAAAPKLRHFVENNSAPPSGQFKVRALHATPSLQGLGVHLQAIDPVALPNPAPVLELSGYDDLSEFRSLEAGRFVLSVTRDDDSALLFQRGQLTITAGTVLTLVIVPRGNGIAVTSLPERANGSVLTSS